MFGEGYRQESVQLDNKSLKSSEKPLVCGIVVKQSQPNVENINPLGLT